jgi:hypothetical protein
LWLRPKRRNGGIITAAQDQALNMHYRQRINMKQPIDSKCRMRCNADEHKKHIVAGCATFAPSKYTNRHSKVAGYIHWKLCKHMGLQVTGRYCERVPEKDINVNSTSIMWDVPVITDQTVLANQPNIVLCDKKEKTCLLIAIAIPDESNFNTKELDITFGVRD